MRISKIFTITTVILFTAIFLGSCSVDETLADEGSRTPLQIGDISVSNNSTTSTRGYTADNDVYTAWQWNSGEEITVTAANSTNTKSCTYVMGTDGTTWNCKTGFTPIYLQDVDGVTGNVSDYTFTIHSYGGKADNSDLQNTFSYSASKNIIITNQSTADKYISSDQMQGTATIGTDKASTSTYRKLSSTLSHQTVDVVVVVKRGDGWGNDETEARNAFINNLTQSNGLPKIYAEAGYADAAGNSSIAADYRIAPFAVEATNGESVTYRAHLPLEAISRGAATFSNGTIIGAVTDAPILKFTNAEGKDVTGKFSLTSSDAIKLAAGTQLLVTFTYNYNSNLETTGIAISSFTPGNGTDGETMEQGKKYLTFDLTGITDNAEISSKLQEIRAILDNMTDAEASKQVVFIKGLTYVPDYTFASCSKLYNISLPAATNIDQWAFYNCANLTSISLPAATTIGDWAFASCRKLTSVSLPVAESLGRYAFHQCSALTTVSLPKVTATDEFIFNECSNLTTVNMPLLTLISNCTFINCVGLKTIYLPAASTMSSNCFRGCSALTSVNLPAATKLGSYTFEGCNALTSISLGAPGSISLYCGVPSSTNCDLTLNVDKKPGGSGDPLASGTVWSSYTWKSITYK